MPEVKLTGVGVKAHKHGKKEKSQYLANIQKAFSTNILLILTQISHADNIEVQPFLI